MVVAAAMALPEPAVAPAAPPASALAPPAVKTVTMMITASIAPWPMPEWLYLNES